MNAGQMDQKMKICAKVILQKELASIFASNMLLREPVIGDLVKIRNVQPKLKTMSLNLLRKTMVVNAGQMEEKMKICAKVIQKKGLVSIFASKSLLKELAIGDLVKFRNAQPKLKTTNFKE